MMMRIVKIIIRKIESIMRKIREQEKKRKNKKTINNRRLIRRRSNDSNDQEDKKKEDKKKKKYANLKENREKKQCKAKIRVDLPLGSGPSCLLGW